MANPAVHIRLDPRDMANLEQQAERLGLSHTQLARSYILIGIRMQEGRGGGAAWVIFGQKVCP